MRYEVTLRGPRGARDVVHVDADGGDDAAAKAFRPHHIITSVQPCPEVADPEPLDHDADGRKGGSRKRAN